MQTRPLCNTKQGKKTPKAWEYQGSGIAAKDNNQLALALWFDQYLLEEAIKKVWGFEQSYIFHVLQIVCAVKY